MQDKIININNKIDREIVKLKRIREMLKGTVYSVKRKSINSAGKIIIRDGYQLTYKGEKNISKTIYVRKSQVLKVKKMIANYRLAKKIIEKIINLNIELFKLAPI